MLDINRIIAFVVTSIAIYFMNKVIKFGFKILILLIVIAAIIYFVMPDAIPVIIDFVKSKVS